MKRKRVIRAYFVRLYPSASKAEALRYTIWWQQRLTHDYINELYATLSVDHISTAGKGRIAALAIKRARDIIRTGFASAFATGIPFACPKTAPAICDARLWPSKESEEFDFWLRPLFTPLIPAKSHKGLNKALRAGGTLRPYCEIHMKDGKDGRQFFAQVWVEYPRQEVAPSTSFLGLDVGVNHSVCRSDGYVGPSLRPVLERKSQRQKQERRRQAKQEQRFVEQKREAHYRETGIWLDGDTRHVQTRNSILAAMGIYLPRGRKRTTKRTYQKQLLDIEARKAILVAKRSGKTLVIERQKTLGNLKPSGKTGGRTLRHLGKRVLQIAEVEGVPVLEAPTAHSSTTCLRCDWSDPRNRRGTEFKCTRCGYAAHADVLGARNLTRMARGVFVREHAVTAK